MKHSSNWDSGNNYYFFSESSGNWGFTTSDAVILGWITLVVGVFALIVSFSM